MQSFANLPTEILELIYTKTDIPTLYSISQLNRHLHYTALLCLFQRANLYQDGTLKDGILTLTPEQLSASPDVVGNRRVILSAIRSAWSIDIHTYAVTLSFESYSFILKRCLMDIQSALEIMKAKKECTKMELTLKSLGRYVVPPRTTSPLPGGWIDTEHWRDVLLGFLEEVLNKGCRDLRIIGGGSLTAVYCDSRGPPIPDLDEFEAPICAEANESWFTQLSSFSSVTSRRLRGISICRPWVLSVRGPTQLTSCILHEEILLRPPFQAWTIHILNNSPNLTSLICTDQSVRPSKWTHILSSITCPALTELRLRLVNLAFKDLCAFLTRHSTHLRVLELTAGPSNIGFYNVTFTEQDWVLLAVDTERCPAIGEALPQFEKENIVVPPMPMLEELSTIPVYFIWFMNKKLGVGNLGGPNTLHLQFPRLKTIHLDANSEYAPTVIGRDFEHIDTAINVLSLYVASFGARGSQSPLKTLVLSSDWDERCAFTDFFRRYLARPKYNASRSATPFRGIRTIRVDMANWLVWQQSTKDLLAFLTVFPDVEALEIVGPKPDELNQLVENHGGAVMDDLTWRVRPVRVQEESMDITDVGVLDMAGL